jgi:hypothetical protein
LRMSCELRGKQFMDADGETMRELNKQRETKSNELNEVVENARFAPVILQQMPMAEPAPRVELSEREKLMVTFWNARYERDNTGRPHGRFSFMQDSQDKREAA